MQGGDNLDQAPVPTGKTGASSIWLVILFTVASFCMLELPFVGLILKPVAVFVTALHELGHALACILTGGTVSGLTIVSDGEGHAGLTFCQGGISFIYNQTGYLGASFFGCLMLWLGKYASRAKATLIGLGLLIGVGSIVFMAQTMFMQGGATQGLLSVLVGLGMAAVLLFAGVKFSPGAAHLLLLFLAVQTALNALTDVKFLIELSLGFYNTTSFSDATNMQQLTGIPASLWSIFWGLASLAMLGLTLKWTYFGKHNKA
jgi:hypothetical protein